MPVDPRPARTAKPPAAARLILLAAPIVLCVSCFAALTSTKPDEARRDDENFQDFLDVPFPGDMAVEKGQSVLYTRRDVLSGRLSLVGSLSTDELLEYFDRHLPPHGWSPRSEVSARKVTVSTWSKGSKTLTIVAENLTLAVGARTRAVLYVAPPHTSADLGHRTVYQSTEKEHGEKYSTTPIRGGGGKGSERGTYSEEDM